MNDELVDVRTRLASSPSVRVELGADGVFHVLAGPVTLHMSRELAEELTTTLARAVISLAKSNPKPLAPRLKLVQSNAQSSRVERWGGNVTTAANPQERNE